MASRLGQVTRADRRLTPLERAAVFHAVKHGEVVLAGADTLELFLGLTVISRPFTLLQRGVLAAEFFRRRDGVVEWITL